MDELLIVAQVCLALAVGAAGAKWLARGPPADF